MKRTFEDATGIYRRGSVTTADVFSWFEKNDDKKVCKTKENVDNPAWLSAHADEKSIKQAISACNSCPLRQGCEFFSSTKVYENFDGVMGGRLVEDTLEG